MLFFLKFQRDSRKNALSLAPAKGKTGKKAVFSTALWRWETTTYYKEPTENIYFSPIIPLMGSMIGAFYWLFLWNFKEKSINHFLWCSPKNCSVMTTATENRIKKLCLQYVVDILSRQKQSHPITEPNISTIQYINHIVWQDVSFLLFPKTIALRGQLAPSLQSTFRQITLRLDPPGKSV